MPKAYAYSQDSKLIIGNECIERIFLVENDKLRTEEIINKKIEGELSLKLSTFSAEFFVGFKTKGFLNDKTEFLSSNELTLDNINIFKNRLEFMFKPYAISGARITFILNYEVSDDSPYISKYIEMMVDENYQKNITIDYLDLEHICFTDAKKPWCIGQVPKAYLSPYHSSLGQPFYVNGMFFVCDFPLAETNIVNNTGYVRYFCGKKFNELKLNCGTTYRTWRTIAGAAHSVNYSSVKQSFFECVRSISRQVSPRFQYNSWYDHMHDITDENITKSFMEIENGLSKSLVEPIDSYVVDDGFVDYKSDFWSFNSKFPNGFSYISKLPKKFSSNFGMWLGPRGGYNSETASFAKRMEKSLKGGYNPKSKDVCVADTRYIKNITDYFLNTTAEYDINYWKLDGFLLNACPSKNHGHITGGYNGMYEYTEAWENWIDIFRKMRVSRETKGKDLWINQTSYCNASPMFLQWADSLWMQNSSDMGRISKTSKGEKLPDADVDSLLTYRDSKYYDFYITRMYQVPPEYIYNHDPIFGNTAKISMEDDEYRKYLFMMATRGNYFWELYYSYNMLNDAKWRINADLMRFVKNNANLLKNSVFIGSNPQEGNVYGYSAWDNGEGIVSLRNPSKETKEFTFLFNEKMGCSEFSGEISLSCIYPYTNDLPNEKFSFGQSITVTLEPSEVAVFKFSKEEKCANYIYSRFESATELLIYFDNRIYITPELISSDKEIKEIELLDDYSTLKIIFAEEVSKAYVSLTYKNSLGKCNDAQVSANFYNYFSCSEKIIPNGRDFTISLKANDCENDYIVKTDDLTLKKYDGGLSLRLFESKARFETSVLSSDILTLVCEPNSLLKLYKNNELLGSVYCKNYVNSLLGQTIEFSEIASDISILSKALKYNEIGDNNERIK